MATVKQTFLKPAVYRVGSRKIRFGAADLRRYMDGTLKALKSGLSIPLLRAHAAPGDPAGGPQVARDAVKDVAGWLKEIKQEKDGSLTHVSEVTDPEVAKGIKDGTVRFVSPEIPLRDYVDGLGRNFGRLFRHLAFTPTPRNPEQSPLAIQFSLDDAISFADDKEKDDDEDIEDISDVESAAAVGESDGSAATEVPASNPDVVEGADPKAAQVDEAIVANLASIGIHLPEGCDISSPEGKMALLAALKTKASADAEDKASDALESEAEAPQVAEVSPEHSMQFDESNPQVAALLKKVRDQSEKLATTARERLVAKARGIPVPSIRRRVVDAVETVQFAESGDEVPRFTVAEVAAFFDGFPANLRFDEEDVSESAPGDLIDSDLSSESAEDAKRAADEQLARVGFRTRPQYEWTNPDPRSGPAVGGGDGISSLDVIGGRKASKSRELAGAR